MNTALPYLAMDSTRCSSRFSLFRRRKPFCIPPLTQGRSGRPIDADSSRSIGELFSSGLAANVPSVRANLALAHSTTIVAAAARDLDSLHSNASTTLPAKRPIGEAGSHLIPKPLFSQSPTEETREPHQVSVTAQTTGLRHVPGLTTGNVAPKPLSTRPFLAQFRSRITQPDPIQTRESSQLKSDDLLPVADSPGHFSYDLESQPISDHPLCHEDGMAQRQPIVTCGRDQIIVQPAYHVEAQLEQLKLENSRLMNEVQFLYFLRDQDRQEADKLVHSLSAQIHALTHVVGVSR